MDNLEKIDKFLERYSLTTLNQEEIENVNRPITGTEFKMVIKNLPKTKVKVQMPSESNFSKSLEKT